MSKFSELYKIDVNKNVEKKNNFNYLSWTYAWKTLQEHEPHSSYEVVKFNGLPVCYLNDGSAIVEVIVTVNDVPRSMWLAVTDYSNKAIKNPSSADVANSTMRCFVKAIAMHGLGLYIYAGEDLPQVPKEPSAKEVMQRVNKVVDKCDDIKELNTLWTDKLMPYIRGLSDDIKDKCEVIYTDKCNEFTGQC